MATHTSTNAFNGRTFGISRQNGQQDKNGRPYFFEWISEIPADAGKRKFETRSSPKGERHYELFESIDGYLTGITTEEKSFGEAKPPETWLILHMNDEGEPYKIEAGSIDGRYAMDVMKRLLDPTFDPDLKLRLSPFSLDKKEGGGFNIGLSAYSGADKLKSSYKEPHLAGMPEPTQTPHKGTILWDYTPVAQWLVDQVKERVLPGLFDSTPVDTNIKPNRAAVNAGFDNPAMAAGFPETEAVTSDSDDLPF